MTDEELKKIEEETQKQDNFVFMREEIKSRPINRKKLARNTFVAAVSAVVFGLVACITFALLAPFVMNRINEKEKEETETVDLPYPVIVSFPEETAEEEMNPADMLISQPEIDLSEITSAEGEELRSLIESMKFSLSDYQGLYKTLSDIANTAMKSMVRVTPMKENIDWLDYAYDDTSELSGLLVGNNGTEYFVLTYYSQVKNSESLKVIFYNGVQAKAELVDYDTTTDMCLISILEEDINEVTKEAIEVATLGASTYNSIVGAPIIAVGSPLGGYKSVNYGIITSKSPSLNLTDCNYKHIITNVYGSSSATGVLVNLKGEVLGIIDTKFSSADTKNLVCALGISELKKPIERMMNRQPTVYFGITGDDVPASVRVQGAPEGVFIKSVDMDSPAMKAGLQSGDIIVGTQELPITSFKDFLFFLREEVPETSDTFRIVRNSQGEYKEISLEVYFDTIRH